MLLRGVVKPVFSELTPLVLVRRPLLPYLLLTLLEVREELSLRLLGLLPWDIVSEENLGEAVCL